MATTATITLASDIMPNYGGYSKTMTLTAAGTLIDIDSTTGFSRRKLATTTITDIVTMANELVETKDSTAAKIYIKNIGYKGVESKDNFVLITVKAQPVGRLYGGDWLLMPLTGIDADDVSATPETIDPVVLEYAMYYEEN
tara:strand:- start:541 stop:963 length:423 start_codon:yes stop_codon:yes gene_type:complete